MEQAGTENTANTDNLETPEQDAPAAAPAGTDQYAPADQDSLKLELAALNDRYLRLMAEYQNYKRRVETEKLQWVDTGKMIVLEPFLEVLDDLQRSLEAADALGSSDPATAYEKLHQGLELITRKVGEKLTAQGVEPIEAVGQPFDVHLHEALMNQPAPDGTEPGTVIGEYQKGYKLGDRILRHSRVIVAS